MSWLFGFFGLLLIAMIINALRPIDDYWESPAGKEEIRQSLERHNITTEATEE